MSDQIAAQKTAIAAASERLQRATLQQAAIRQAKARMDLEESIGPQSTTTVGQSAAAFGQVGMTLLSGAIIEPVAGAVGFAEGVYKGVMGDEDALDDAERRIQQIRDDFTFQPRTDAGRDALEFVAQPFQAFAEFADELGTATMEKTGSPLAATAVRAGIELAPSLVGAKAPGNILRNRRDIADVEKSAERAGVDLDVGEIRGPSEQRMQIVESAEREVGGRTVRGEDIESVQTKIQGEREKARLHVDELYESARRERAGLPAGEAKQFQDIARKSLEDFDVEDMPIVSRRLKELEMLDELPDSATIKLQALERWRRKLSTNKPASTDLSQGLALGVLKAQYDNFMDAKFNADMISGNPEALTAWKSARGANADYRSRFRDHKMIKQLSEQRATPEEVRSWIFGASAVGAKKEAGAVLTRLRDILGPDSPEFTALRQDALLDILEPALRQEPNLPQLVKNVDRVMKNSPTLVAVLLPDSKTAMRDLRKLASAVEGVETVKLPFEIEKAIARVGVGHAIAKGGVKVQAATTIMQILRRAAGVSRKRKIMGHILGYDPMAPVIRRLPVVAIGGAIQAGIEAGKDGEERQSALNKKVTAP